MTQNVWFPSFSPSNKGTPKLESSSKTTKCHPLILPCHTHPTAEESLTDRRMASGGTWVTSGAVETSPFCNTIWIHEVGRCFVQTWFQHSENPYTVYTTSWHMLIHLRSSSQENTDLHEWVKLPKNPLAPSMRQDSLHRLSPAFSVFLCFGTPVKPQAPNIGKSNSNVHKIVKDVLHPLSTSWKRCYFPGLDHFDHLGLVSLVHPRHKTDQHSKG